MNSFPTNIFESVFWVKFFSQNMYRFRALLPNSGRANCIWQLLVIFNSDIFWKGCGKSARAYELFQALEPVWKPSSGFKLSSSFVYDNLARPSITGELLQGFWMRTMNVFCSVTLDWIAFDSMLWLATLSRIEHNKDYRTGTLKAIPEQLIAGQQKRYSLFRWRMWSVFRDTK